MRRLLAIGLFVRAILWCVCSAAPPQIVDAIDYDGLAVRLAERNAYVADDGMPISLRPPLYPFAVSIVYRIAGVQNYAVVFAIQSLIGLLTTQLVFRLGIAVYNERIGLAAATLFCFYPTFLAYEQLLLTEVTATCLLCAATLQIVRAQQLRSLFRLVVAGGLYGLAALTRSATLLFIPFVALWLMGAWSGRVLPRLTAATIICAAFAAVIAPWAYRNTRLQHTVTMIDVMGGRNAMMGNYEFTPLERSWAAIDLAQGDQAWFRVLQQAYPTEYKAGVTQGQIDKLAMRYAVRFMLANPGLTAQRSLVKSLNFWQLEREIVAGARRGIFGVFPSWAVLALAVVVCGYYAACLFGAIFGMLLVPIGSRPLQALFLLTILVPWAAHSLIFAHSRYHLPLVPLLCIFAAAAFIQFREVAQRRSSVQGIAAFSFCLLFVAAWLREFVMVDWRFFS
jgi:4-amino-4-deoxy-L-arabinose transferase-like glycosyltransferase